MRVLLLLLLGGAGIAWFIDSQGVALSFVDKSTGETIAFEVGQMTVQSPEHGFTATIPVPKVREASASHTAPLPPQTLDFNELEPEVLRSPPPQHVESLNPVDGSVIGGGVISIAPNQAQLRTELKISFRNETQWKAPFDGQIHASGDRIYFVSPQYMVGSIGIKAETLASAGRVTAGQLIAKGKDITVTRYDGDGKRMEIYTSELTPFFYPPEGLEGQ